MGFLMRRSPRGLASVLAFPGSRPAISPATAPSSGRARAGGARRHRLHGQARPRGSASRPEGSLPSHDGTANDQEEPGAKTAFLGREQLRWLERALLASNATWKIIASDMPIGLVVTDGKDFENCANGNGPPRGRELEIAGLR
ncbi:MAG: hypothetical protein GY711_18580 [bacterium]|nr:hypothetical protein [bacterium]